MQSSLKLSRPQMFLSAFDGIKSSRVISIFPDFYLNCLFFLTETNLPWLLPNLEELFFFISDHFLRNGNPEYRIKTNLELCADCRRVFGCAFASLHCSIQVIKRPNSHVSFGFQTLTNLGQRLKKSNAPHINNLIQSLEDLETKILKKGCNKITSLKDICEVYMK